MVGQSEKFFCNDRNPLLLYTVQHMALHNAIKSVLGIKASSRLQFEEHQVILKLKI